MVLSWRRCRLGRGRRVPVNLLSGVALPSLGVLPFSAAGPTDAGVATSNLITGQPAQWVTRANPAPFNPSPGPKRGRALVNFQGISGRTKSATTENGIHPPTADPLPRRRIRRRCRGRTDGSRNHSGAA